MTTRQDVPKTHAALLAIARRDLKTWAAVYGQRDARVTQAARSGLGVNEIARLTGLAKTTVLRILAANR